MGAPGTFTCSPGYFYEDYESDVRSVAVVCLGNSGYDEDHSVPGWARVDGTELQPCSKGEGFFAMLH